MVDEQQGQEVLVVPRSKKPRGCTRLCIGRFLVELSGDSNDQGEICTMTTGGHIPITR